MKNLLSVFLFCLCPILYAVDLPISTTANDTTVYVGVDKYPDDLPMPTTANDTTVYVGVDKYPEFKGGMEALYQFLGSEIIYPDSAKETSIQGRVICQFVVNTDGSIVDIIVVRGVHPLLDQESIRIIEKMPNWIPGENNGKVVRVKYILPIIFKISE